MLEILPKIPAQHFTFHKYQLSYFKILLSPQVVARMLRHIWHALFTVFANLSHRLCIDSQYTLNNNSLAMFFSSLYYFCAWPSVTFHKAMIGSQTNLHITIWITNDLHLSPKSILVSNSQSIVSFWRLSPPGPLSPDCLLELSSRIPLGDFRPLDPRRCSPLQNHKYATGHCPWTFTWGLCPQSAMTIPRMCNT